MIASELAGARLDDVTWREVAGPWDADGKGPVTRMLREMLANGQAASRCALALAVGEARRGNHAEAHALLKRSIATQRDEPTATEVEVEVLALAYTDPAWTPPAWTERYVPFSARGGKYASRVQEFLSSLRAGDLATADTIAQEQFDEVPGLPVWGEFHLRRSSGDAARAWKQKLKYASRFTGTYAWPSTALGAP